MIEVIRADGRVAGAESMLFWEALDAWNLRLEEIAGYRRRPAAGTGPGKSDKTAKPHPRRAESLS
jgi:hypothetical protein